MTRSDEILGGMENTWVRHFPFEVTAPSDISLQSQVNYWRDTARAAQEDLKKATKEFGESLEGCEETEKRLFQARDELVDRYRAEHAVRLLLTRETYSINYFRARYARSLLKRVDKALRGTTNDNDY